MNKKLLGAILSIAAVAAVTVFVVNNRRGSRPGDSPATTVKYALLSTAVVDSTSVIAVKQDLWSQGGVQVAPLMFKTGRDTAQSLIGNQAHLATMADWPFLLSTRQNPDLRAVAVITSAYSLDIVARKSKGIEKPGDLRGKKIGVSVGTTGQFVLEAGLESKGVSKDEYQALALSPPDMVAAFQRGDLDAICTWQPNIQKALDLVGDDALSLGMSKFFRVKYLLVTRQRYIDEHPEELAAVLRGLISAEEFIRDSVMAAKSHVSAVTGTEAGLLDEIWGLFEFRVAMDAELLEALRRQEMWARDTGTIPKSAPDVDWMRFIDGSVLAKLDAERVTLDANPSITE